MELRSSGCLKTCWLLAWGCIHVGSDSLRAFQDIANPEAGMTVKKMVSIKSTCTQVRLPANASYDYPWVIPYRPQFLPQLPRLKQEITLDFGLHLSFHVHVFHFRKSCLDFESEVPRKPKKNANVPRGGLQTTRKTLATWGTVSPSLNYYES